METLDFERGFLFVGRDGGLYHAAFQEPVYYMRMSPKASLGWSVAEVDTEYGNTTYSGSADTKWLDAAQKDKE